MGIAFVLATCLVALCIISPASTTALSYQCANPLFRAHWHSASAQHDAGQMRANPIAQTNLVRCKMWNYNPSCCSPSMEAPQQLAFDSRRAQLEAKVGLLKAYMEELTTLSTSDIALHSDSGEQVLLSKAVESFRPLLGASGKCARALMGFAAGMVCFGCNPNWSEFVWREASGHVTAVNVDREACVAVDERCSRFGRAARSVVDKVMASSLAKTPQTPLPDLSMFADRETLCAWLRGTLAMQPLRSAIPGQAVAGDASLLHGTSASTVNMTTVAPGTDIHLPTAPPYSTKPSAALDPVRDGSLSGFDLDAAAVGIAEAPAQMKPAQQSVMT